jgi:flagellar biosynthesis protein FlhG
VTDRFLQFVPQYLGAIPYDEHLRRAIQAQRAVVECYPWSAAAAAFKKIALAADKWTTAQHPHGGIEFFVDRLLRTASQQTESSLQ